jgi:hypothetical protein
MEEGRPMRDDVTNQLVRLFARERFPDGLPENYPDEEFCDEFFAWQERQTDPAIVRLVRQSYRQVFREMLDARSRAVGLSWKAGPDGKRLPRILPIDRN